MSDALAATDALEAQSAALLTEFLDEFADARSKSTYKYTWWSLKPSELESGQRILRQERRLQAIVVRQALVHAVDLVRSPGAVILPAHGWYELTAEQRANVPYVRARSHAAMTIATTLCRRTLPFTPDDVDMVCGALAHDGPHPYSGVVLSSHPILKAFRPLLRDAEALAQCRPALDSVRAAVQKQYPSAAQRDMLRTLEDLQAGDARDEGVSIYSDEWGDQVKPLLETIEARDAWMALLRRCAEARGSAPSAKWLRDATDAREALGSAAFGAGAVELLGAFRNSSNKPPTYTRESPQPTHAGCILDGQNANLLRGVIWLCTDSDDPRLIAALGDGVIAGYRKIPLHGPRSAKIASACVYALQRAPHLSGAAQLDRARLMVKQPQFVRAIEHALADAAKQAGISREELEEMAVPTFGLQDSRLRVTVGSATAEVAVVGGDVTLTWYGADGKPRKAPPAEVKRECVAQLKDVKRLRDDLAHLLDAQAARLERLPLAQRQWPLAQWRERYLDHPLVGLLARRLIWRFTWDGAQVDGAWLGGALVDVDDHPLSLPDDATVTTWHPVFASAAETLAWRVWLERHEITQPFKQGRREVYLLTDAERATRVYSNRFAGHILRQHQFNALCAARGWRNSLRLMVDDSYPPATLELPQYHLRVEFWIEGAGDTYETDTNAAGTYLRVSTDQVRFYPHGGGVHYAHAAGGGYAPMRHAAPTTPIPLEEIPALVLSEVMRDIDLFVGVSSVGADPTWQDGGPGGRYRVYWQSYSFGELSTSGETRRELLERLLPRLTLANRCRIDGRFLRVRGDLREYKIHLGSGNILMEPNDQYLCIVQSRSADTGSIYLPFEGDNMLAVILSKAFLLAADTKITDPTITRQISVR